MGKLLEDLKKEQEMIKNYRIEEENLTLKEQKELDELKSQIKEKYASLKNPIYKKINDSKKQIKIYSERIMEFSTFNSAVIGKILAYLMTVYEGEEYCYQETIHHTTKTENCIFDRITYDIDKKIKIIIKLDEKRYEYFKYENLYEKVVEGLMIILEQNENRLSDDIIFKIVDSQKNGITDNVNYGEFGYVREFINYLIDFRINNDKFNISEKEINELLKVFLESKKDKIEANYKLRLKEKEKELKQKQKQFYKQFKGISN